MTKADLELLREEGRLAIERLHAAMDASHSDRVGANIRNNRYFIEQPSRAQPRLKSFLFSQLMADVCRATIGPEAFLCYEQFVVKGAEKGKAFSWHQDGGYAISAGAAPHAPGVTCWCALDDMSEANGTIYVLPYERAGGRDLVEHVYKPELGERVGYFGDDPGNPVLVPAGTIVAFSTATFHRSGFNTTGKMRRVYTAQYAPAPLRKADGSGIVGLSDLFLKDGEIVAHGPDRP